MSEQSKSINTERQRGFAIAHLLFVATAVCAAVLVGAMSEPKIPPYVGD